MKINYQGIIGSYSSEVSQLLKNSLNIETSIYGNFSFKDVFQKINNKNLLCIPIENSYAGPIYENFYHIYENDVEIVGEYYKMINHKLLAKTKDISKIKKVYSHIQALMQCEKYINNNGIKLQEFSDTALAAKMISESKDDSIGAIASGFCSEIYGLNILDSDIQDQGGNTTRFLIIKDKSMNNEIFENNEFIKNFKNKKGKISIIFKTKDEPAILYKCLGSFATKNINLSKIESLPSKENPFEYIFWIDIEKPNNDEILEEILNELNFFTKFIKIIGKY
ncbi:prephenate dehydratase [Candidatus Vampirococcus lugosii]|uniref:prephenate dehydratase n=1 Tax=Candidatus Vampirococcus lugosii TaxID=2789015 RepID=A0ABS5QME7_9BACT|nr:prephenate dehydratase domain-containing protein [Candidatus Vampirococcus lugosii]MBS8122381.1 prephenate dehydratase [Candidatus Vampirococcus lugosii]